MLTQRSRDQANEHLSDKMLVDEKFAAKCARRTEQLARNAAQPKDSVRKLVKAKGK